jgi:hypothetical protein
MIVIRVSSAYISGAETLPQLREDACRPALVRTRAAISVSYVLLWLAK